MTVEATTQPLFVDVAVAAEMLGLTRASTYNAVKSGDIPAKKFAGMYKIPTSFLKQMAAGEIGECQPARTRRSRAE